MAIGKMLKLGGIDNRPPKADQAMGKFRVARNVYCTPDNRLIPRYDNTSSPLVGSVKCVHNISQYGDSVLSFFSYNPGISGYTYRLQKDGIVVPRSSSFGVSPFTARTEDYPQQVQSLRNRNTQYYLCPYDGTMLKYDGVEVSYTGVHQPIVYTSQVNFAGTKFLKVIQHRIDFDGTAPASETVSFSVLNTVTSLSLRTDKGLNILDPALSTFATSVSEQLITPKVAGDVYYKETTVTYYTNFASLPATGVSGRSYATITNNTWYFWNGAGYTLISTLPLISTTAASLPAIGAYDTVYRVTYPSAPLKYLRWQVNQRNTITYPNLADFPVTGVITAYAYYAQDTQLTYFWKGSSYVLAPNGGEYVELVNGSNYNGIQFENTTNRIYICAGDSNISNENIGAYVIVVSTIAGANVNFIGLPIKYLEDTIAYRIVSATSYGAVKAIVLDNASVKVYTNATFSWTDVATDIADGYPLADASARSALWAAGSRNVVTIWSSSSKEGVFFRKGTLFSFPDSSRYYYGLIDITTVGVSSGVVSFIPAQTLNDVYDVTSAPISVNENYEYGDIPLTSMTTYNGALLISSNIAIWYSSPKKPLWFEMLNTKSFINIGSTEYGRITSICGTNEFFFVSRERKNYYITGNLSTGNYRVQNVTETETGAWGNTSAISVKDSVIFINAKGIYQTVEGGRTSLVSDTCPKNFNTFDAMNVNEDVVFKVDGFHSNPLNGVTTDNSICVAYDEYRDLLAFMQKSEGNPCLILSTKTKEFYEWNGMISSPDVKANCITFIYSKYYLGGFTPATATAGNFVESKGSDLAYITNYPVKLYTTWLTGGEPSLEKILLQLKIFGRIDSDASLYSIDVCHYKDWDLSTKITNSQYFPLDTSLSLNNQIQYSHKKRLNSDKVLSASVGIEVSKAAISFEIESLEVEFLPIQQGMKR